MTSRSNQGRSRDLPPGRPSASHFDNIVGALGSVPNLLTQGTSIAAARRSGSNEPPTQPSSRPKDSNDPPPYGSTNVFKKIRGLQPDQSRACTELILRLLQINSLEASRLSHSPKTISFLFETLGGLYAAIDAKISVVADPEQNADAVWDAFMVYTAAIPDLERILLDLNFLTSEGAEGLMPSVNQVSVSESTDHIVEWERLREVELRIVEKLATSESLRGLGIITPEWQRFADSTVLQDDVHMQQFLLTYLNNYTLASPAAKAFFGVTQGRRGPVNGSGVAYLKSVREQAQGLITASGNYPPLSEPTRRWIIKGLLLVATPLSILSSTKEVNSDVLSQMKSQEVWSAVEDMLSKIQGIFQPTTAVADDELGTSYRALRTELEKIPGLLDLSVEIGNLLKAYAQIRRPFTARTLEMIKLVRELDNYSRKPENKAIAERRILKDTVESVANAFADVARGVQDVRTFPKDNQHKTYKAVDVICGEAIGDLVNCAESFKFCTEDDVDARVNAASQIDDRLFGDFHQRLAVTRV